MGASLFYITCSLLRFYKLKKLKAIIHQTYFVNA